MDFCIRISKHWNFRLLSMHLGLQILIMTVYFSLLYTVYNQKKLSGCIGLCVWFYDSKLFALWSSLNITFMEVHLHLAYGILCNAYTPEKSYANPTIVNEIVSRSIRRAWILKESCRIIFLSKNPFIIWSSLLIKSIERSDFHGLCFLRVHLYTSHFLFTDTAVL